MILQVHEKKKTNNLTNVKKRSVCCVENTPRLPIAQARFFLVRRALGWGRIRVFKMSEDSADNFVSELVRIN